LVLQFSGRLTAVTDGEKTLAEYVYSASGNPVVKKIGGNVTSTYAYDELLNIKALKTEAGKQALADNHYFYDGNGNQIRREGLEGTTGYAYDERNRLTEITYPSALGGYTEKLSYDAAGNRIRRETEQEITTYHYDNCNRLQELRREYKNAETATTQPEMIRYTYDRQGNTLREKSMKSGEEKKYSYDSFGRMVRAEVPVESPGTR
jgi:YD repeat-containing protein